VTRVTYRPRMPELAYHSDPALSSTGARRLLQSPAAFDWWRKNPEKPRAEFDLGSAIHTAVLGTGYGIEVLDARFENWRTNDAKNAAADARAAGKIPMLAHEYAKVAPVREAVLRHPLARRLAEQPGRPEVSVFSTDPETGIEQRARFDFLPLKSGARRVAWDLKSTTDARPSVFAKSVARFGYDVAHEHYLHVISPDAPDPLLDFMFVVVEVEPPHHVSVTALTREFREIGAEKAARARRIFAECLRAEAAGDPNPWPGLDEGLAMIAPPVFHVYDHLDAQQAQQEQNR
jgi:hypothetical protein